MGKSMRYEGLWKGSTSWYVSKGFTKKQLEEMPKKFRLVLRENRYHKNNEDGTPRFIFGFVDADKAEEFRYGVEKGKCESCVYYCQDEMTQVHYCGKFSSMLEDGLVFKVSDDFFCGFWEEEE